MANGVHFPEEIMLNIQIRLPVKSIIRFKSVCKPWLSLFSSPQFIKLHGAQFSSDPKNQSAIFYERGENKISFLNTTEKKPAIIPFCPHLENRHFMQGLVGCCNGLVCTVFRFAWPNMVFVIWNPATKFFKSLSLKSPQWAGRVIFVSLGFGYDVARDDYKVVMIFYLEEFLMDREGVGVVQVYSFKSSSLVTLRVGFQFRVSSVYNDVIVNGNPYWVAKVDGNEVLVYCDVTNLVCKIVPLPSFYVEDKVKFVDWNGVLGALVCPDENERVFKSLDVWVFDDVANIWRKIHTFDPIEGCVDRYLERLKNGYLIGERPDGKLFVFDPDSGCVEEILIDVAKKWGLQVHGYVESLACLERREGRLMEVQLMNVAGQGMVEASVKEFLISFERKHG